MPGKTMMLTAKISGIMPAELTRSGMNVVVAAIHAGCRGSAWRDGPGSGAGPH